MHHGEFRDPRLVEVYDAECPWGPDDDWFLAVASRTPAARVLDYGCGTGRLTLALAASGHTVTGVDPAAASLAAARTKPGAEAVTWIEGTAEVLPADAFDGALMTSHVAQFHLADEEWSATLAALGRALVPGGWLCFDTRDPRDRRWERWNPVDSQRQVTLADGTAVQLWTEVTEVSSDDAPTVHFTHHYRFADDSSAQSTAALRFRTEDEVRASLAQAGFTVESIHGGWQSDPVGHQDGELLVLARRS